MNIIKRFLKKRELVKHQADAERILSLINPYLNYLNAGGLQKFILQQRISSWSLSNQFLLDYLGYIAGVIDAADNLLENRSTDNWTATEIAFHKIIVAQLDWIPGSEAFIELNRIGIEFGGTTIGGLQNNPQFLEAMRLGGIDFLSSRLPDFHATGHHLTGHNKLGLLTGVKHEDTAEYREWEAAWEASRKD
jgi:hypothetical protein